MRAYVVATGKTIEPFGDHRGERLIANRQLTDLQREALEAAGVAVTALEEGQEIDDPDEHLVLDDSLHLSIKLDRFSGGGDDEVAFGLPRGLAGTLAG